MGRLSNALSVAKIKTLNSTGRYADGNGLYLQISKWGTKAWIYRYAIGKRRREMGLGSINDVSLAEARAKARNCRTLLLQNIDPKIQRDAELRLLHQEQDWTFDRCADAYIEAHKPSWKNKKHVAQWYSTLATYASPVIGNLPVRDVDTALVMRVVEPIWRTKTETASRVRGRIEKVLAWAIVSNYRDHPNPALWRNNLDQLLPAPNTIVAEKHHAALPYAEAPIFMASWSHIDSTVSEALRFTIMTAMRTKAVIGASWDEIDFRQGVWTIDADRMKAIGLNARSHRVPLSEQAIQLLKELNRVDGWLFPSNRSGMHISNNGMLAMLKKQLNRPDLTVHGFRSTFRDWCAETTNHPREIAEAALAHKLKDKTEAAYQRGDLLEKRRVLMQDWADYLHNQENVISLSGNVGG